MEQRECMCISSSSCVRISFFCEKEKKRKNKLGDFERREKKKNWTFVWYFVVDVTGGVFLGKNMVYYGMCVQLFNICWIEKIRGERMFSDASVD